MKLLRKRHSAKRRANIIERMRRDGKEPLCAHIESAFAADRQLIDEAANGKTRNAIRAMQLEAEMAMSPIMRARSFRISFADYRQDERFAGAHHPNQRIDRHLFVTMNS